ncbi:putative patatin-like phospholipase domain-containing protein [Lyophyllum shimeji]|uniref:Patatin-like phospholipase domain-containing protein n=1 Tax=Lyophyllum shimeji TaxID=47721 RepID=A0A9P3PE74_LYOSH|nr:putative patatin-like phospholipase domain-containing protein [Lyophyllum shimeji]
MSSSNPANGSRRSKLTTEELLAAEYIEESHIQAFADALGADELLSDNHDASSPNIPGTPVSQTGAPQGRVRKVAALSDFAPVNLRVKRRRKKDKPHDKRSDWLFLLLRWPLLFFIFLFIAAEFGFYVVIRQLVNTKEYITAWRGKKGLFRKKLRAARNYEEWKEAAATLDEYLQFHEWKKVDEDPFYDWKLVRKVRRSLKTLREKKDARGCLGVLETCIRANFAGVESPRLYSETFLGTKDLIESYFTELEKSLEFIRETPELSIDEKKRFFKSANTNLGISALCLSGGASFGYYHVGVIKAFLDANLLPRVITGTSAGGLIAALVCTRTDEELKPLLVPELANRITACEEPYSVWVKRLWKTGARFDSVQWARKCMFFTRGSMTFKEAYMRTGRILNISVIPADRHSPTKLLNYMTAPNTLIWTALLASAAVPGILNPVVLMHKLPDGTIAPWNWGSKFKDGSLRVDIPIQSLNLYFNVTHPVVSQVNPHVHLFFFAPRGSAGKPVAHRKGKGWRGNFLLSAAEQWLKHELSKNFKVIRDLELLPQILGQDWSSVFLQKFEGAVTIWPKTRIWDWFRLLHDPDAAELQRMIRVGESVAWPKLHMIENRAKIEKQILMGREYVRKVLRGRVALPEPRPMVPRRPTSPGPSVDPRIPPTAPSPPSSSEHPISVDTDAEAAFSRGSRWFFKRGQPDASTSPASRACTPNGGPKQDPLRSPTIRKKWTSQLLKPTLNGDDSGTDPSYPPSKPPHDSTRSDTFLSRLRARSFPNLASPFSGDMKRLGRDSTDVAERAWSSDSSSENEFQVEERRPSRHPSGMNSEAVDGDGPLPPKD